MMDKFGPPINRSMKELDRSFFKKDVNLLVACFSDPKLIGSFVKQCKFDILLLPSIKHIINVTPTTKGVLLRDDVDDINTFKEKLHPLTLEKIEEFGISIQKYTMKLNYDFWKADDILRAVLPQHLIDDIPSGFAQAGHVAHINLKEEFKPYGSLIGQVILDKNPKVETVVDKMDTIDTKFRTFKMKVLAGKDDLFVEQNEGGCRFQFDFSKVYWNSRLSTEHENLVNKFKPHTVVCDVFAGVGPFVLPAGKKEVIALANDLNPESFRYLKNNITLNHVEDFVKPFNLDGRDFIKQSPALLLELLKKQQFIQKRRVIKKRKIEGEELSKKHSEIVKIEIPPYISHYVMNLPDSAFSFLDCFIGLYSDDSVSEVRLIPNFSLPTINVHCFEKYSPQEQPEPSIEELHRRVHAKITKILEYNIPFEDLSFHLVRKVAPTKPMFCVSFTLPEEVAFRKI